MIQAGIWILNPDTGELCWSREMYHIVGVDPSDGPPPCLKMMSRIHPDDRAQLDTGVQRAISEGSDFEGEHRIFMPDGGMKRLRFFGHPVETVDGKAREYVGTVIDVTSSEIVEAHVTNLLQEMRAQAALMLLAVFRDGNGTSPHPESPSAETLITPRERQVLQLVAEANTSKQAAARMGISVKTVESHRTSIMKKLQLHSVTELVRYAIRNGIVQL